MISPPTEILFNCIKECKTLCFDVTETLRNNVKWILHQAEQQYLMFKKQTIRIYINTGICLHV